MIPTRIIVHHSLTKDGTTVSWGDIRRFHMTDPAYMFTDIGYHAGVELIESGGHSVYYEILMGRMWTVPGAHTHGYNHDSLGICFVGNYDVIVPSDEMLMSGAKVIALWRKLFDIPPDRIFGHNEFASKSCPGNLFPLNTLINMVNTVYDMQ
jgi:N-acetylmuramoyl-L-alanine amidase